MSESLRRIVEALGPDSVTKLVNSTNRVTAAASVLGVYITTEDVLSIESVKLHCLADMDVNLEAAIEQLKLVPAVAARLQEKRDAELVTQGHTDRIAGMSRQQRISYARLHNLTASTGVAESRIGKAEHLAIMAGLGASQRLSYARRHGLEGGS